jgi:photosystem II stability/assembly factor-like uncharacterized protein
MVRILLDKCRRILAISLFVTSASLLVANGQSGWTGSRGGQQGKDLNAVFFVDSKRGWIAGDGGFISRTDDGGLSWTQQPIKTTDPINDVYFRNRDDGYLISAGRIFTTENGGVQWIEGHSFSSSGDKVLQLELYSVRFTSKKRGWIVGSLSRTARNGDSIIADSVIYRTTDGGNTWERQGAPTKQELIHLDFANEKLGWIVGSGGTILRTDDGGDTWRAQESRTNATLYHVDFRGEKRGWAVGERGTIVRTTDGGQTWSIVPNRVTATLLSVQFMDDDNGWIVGRGGIILRSGDGGLTWVHQESTVKQNLYGLYVDKKNGWAVGGDGTVLHYRR